jgi:hypothetical protein
MGVIAWSQWLIPDREAQQDAKKAEDPGPLKDKKMRKNSLVK